MTLDRAWLLARIRELHRSQRRLAPKLRNRKGKPLDQATLTYMLSGRREITLGEVRQLARALQVPRLEILVRLGVLTRQEIQAYQV